MIVRLCILILFSMLFISELKKFIKNSREEKMLKEMQEIEVKVLSDELHNMRVKKNSYAYDGVDRIDSLINIIKLDKELDKATKQFNIDNTIFRIKLLIFVMVGFLLSFYSIFILYNFYKDYM